MKFNQTSADNSGEGDVSWVDLGHASSADVKALIDKKLNFSDIFEVGEQNADGTCGEGFGVSIGNGIIECLKVKPGMDLAASRLETRRFAALKGATVELRKEEGVTYDPDHKRLYVAMSEVGNGMTDMGSDGKYEKGGNNDFRVAANPCGGVYTLDLDDSFTATNLKGMVFGKPASYADTDQWAGNKCDIDHLGNPDNISYVPGRDTLFIGEDATTAHQNDAVWSYNVTSGELTRILTTPYGAESTSVYAYPNVNEFGYVMAVVQHPYGESDEDKLQSPNDAQAYLGYIGPFPKFD
jgi:secreted PhoX family phosphatase